MGLTARSGLGETRSGTVRAGRWRLALVLAGAGVLGSGRVWAVERPEIEPNNTKAQADLNGVFVLAPGDSVAGTTTGTSTTTAGVGSADYFRIRTTPQPLGIYRHTLALVTSGATGHTPSLRGQTQTAGVINLSTDTSAQFGSSLTNPPRAVAWYGFGRQEELYFRVTGTSATIGPYFVTHTEQPVAPSVAPDQLFAGLVRITAAAVSPSLIDTDTWLYDGGLNAIAGAGNDDVFGSPAGGPSAFTRTLVPGEYTLAVSLAQLSNNQPSPADDDVRNGVVLDYPNAVSCSIVNNSGVSQTGTVLVTINDFVNPPATVQLTFGAGAIGEVRFVRFTLTPDPMPSGACCLVDGSCVSATSVGCGVQGGAYQGDSVLCAGVSCPPPGSCCDSGGCCSVTLQSACPAGDRWTAGAVCVPNTCPPPLNDLCAGAIALTLNTPISASNCNATGTGDGPVATCQTTAGKAVWYSFTPAATGTYQFSTCGSTQDTVLTILTSPNCTSFTEINCDDDGCDGANPPGSDLASISRVLTIPGGMTYLVRLSSFGTAPAGGPFTLVVNAVASGACCDNVTGACTVVIGGGSSCIAGTYRGDGSVCTPSPCPPSGACCRGSCCFSTVQSACAGNWFQGLACSPSACPSPANDACAGAIPIALGVAVAGDNCGATSAGDGPAAACQNLAGKGVWYSLTPTHTGSYRVSTCGSNQDTVIQVLTSPDCAVFTLVGANGGVGGCDDDACDGASPPGSTLASEIGSITLASETPYLIRIASFGATPAGGLFSLVVTANNALGACCDSGGACTLTDEPACAAPRAFQADALCQPNPCTPPSGACCSGSTCAVAAGAQCSGANQAFQGVGTSCNPPGNLTTPCCLADFNHVAGVSVQDIFDFLAAYFNSDPFADLNGGGISVQDIFDFLAGYFGGCP